MCSSTVLHKCVLLFNGNKHVSIPISYSTCIKEKVFLKQKKTMEDNEGRLLMIFM